jgi:hypothetical protein
MPLHKVAGERIIRDQKKPEKIEGNRREIMIGFEKFLGKGNHRRPEELGKVGGGRADERLDEGEHVDAEGKGRGLADAIETETAEGGRDELENTQIWIGNARVKKPDDEAVKVGLGERG